MLQWQEAPAARDSDRQRKPGCVFDVHFCLLFSYSKSAEKTDFAMHATINKCKSYINMKDCQESRQNSITASTFVITEALLIRKMVF